MEPGRDRTTAAPATGGGGGSICKRSFQTPSPDIFFLIFLFFMPVEAKSRKSLIYNGLVNFSLGKKAN